MRLVVPMGTRGFFFLLIMLNVPRCCSIVANYQELDNKKITCGTKGKVTAQQRSNISQFTLLHEKFLQFDWLGAVVFQLNLKYLHVKSSNL